MIPPSPITRVDAAYPSGVAPTTLDVELAVEIDEEGHVVASDVVKSGGAPFDAAATAAAKQWTFNDSPIGPHRAHRERDGVREGALEQLDQLVW